MPTADDIIQYIDDLIAAKLSGATDLSQFYSRTIGSLSISPAASIKELMEIRDMYRQQSGPAETETYVF
jgi:hypothetical protein